MANETSCIKVYDTSISISYITLTMISLASNADEKDENGGMIITFNICTKKKIAQLCNISLSRINHTISLLKKTNMIRRLYYGVYQFNPYKVGKGSWKDICAARKIWDETAKFNNDDTDEETDD